MQNLNLFSASFTRGLSAFLITSVTVIALNGCRTDKTIGNITETHAKTLRDSANKYAWACLDVKKAAVYYDSLFASKYLIKRDYYDAGQVYAEVGNYSKGISIWTKMRKVKNDDEFDYAYFLPDLVGRQFFYYEGHIKARGFKKLWSHYKEYPLDPRLSHTDSLLVKQINQMFIADQTVRINYRNNKTPQNAYLWKRCDSLNWITMDSIIVNRGIITTKKFGYKPSKDFSILFAHLTDSLLKKNMPLITDAYKAGGICKMYFALIADKYSLYDQGHQIYGTQFGPDNATNKNKIFPIAKIKRVDKRRKEMGLPSLASYAEKNNAKLPDDYPRYNENKAVF